MRIVSLEHPTEIPGAVGVAVEAGRQIGADENIRASVVTADGIPAKDHATSRRHAEC